MNPPSPKSSKADTRSQKLTRVHTLTYHVGRNVGSIVGDVGLVVGGLVVGDFEGEIVGADDGIVHPSVHNRIPSSLSDLTYYA